MTLALLGIFTLLFIAQGWYRNRGATFDGLPDDQNTADKWKGTDNDTWYARWTIRFNGWQAFGPYSKYSWARWTFPPKVLLKIGGKGPWRYENVQPPFASNESLHPGYVCLSRCQYFKRWAFVVEWPLSFRFHIYWRAADVPVEGTIWTNEFSIKKLLFFYGPSHWDTTPVYWLLSFYFGGQWK